VSKYRFEHGVEDRMGVRFSLRISKESSLLSRRWVARYVALDVTDGVARILWFVAQ